MSQKPQRRGFEKEREINHAKCERRQGVSVPWDFISQSFVTSVRPTPKEWAEQKLHQSTVQPGRRQKSEESYLSNSLKRSL